MMERIDNKGYLREQLWYVMLIFGKHLNVGQDDIMEMEVTLECP